MLAKALIRGIAVANSHVAIQQEVGLLLVMEAADTLVTDTVTGGCPSANIATSSLQESSVAKQSAYCTRRSLSPICSSTPAGEEQIPISESVELTLDASRNAHAKQNTRMEIRTYQ